MKRRRRYATKSEINIVPLLDVLLVLVLIFMATAPIINQSVEVDLPQVTESKQVSTLDVLPVIIEVSKQGYAVVADQKRRENLSSDEVLTQVKALKAANDQTIFLIGGDKEVPYNDVMQVLNLLQEAGISSVSLMTQPL